MARKSKVGKSSDTGSAETTPNVDARSVKDWMQSRDDEPGATESPRESRVEPAKPTRGPGGRFLPKKKPETPEDRAKRFMVYAQENLATMMAVLEVGGIEAARPMMEIVRSYLDQVDAAMGPKKE